jgi:hypothetical protein
MRSIVIAAVIAAGLGLAGVTAASAVPASGTNIGIAAQHDSQIQKVQHWRWGSRRWWRRCHYRRWSRWGRC